MIGAMSTKDPFSITAHNANFHLCHRFARLKIKQWLKKTTAKGNWRKGVVIILQVIRSSVLLYAFLPSYMQPPVILTSKRSQHFQIRQHLSFPKHEM